MFTTHMTKKASLGRPVAAAVAGVAAAGLLLAAQAAPANAAAGIGSGGKVATAKSGFEAVAPVSTKSARRVSVPIASAVLAVNRMPWVTVLRDNKIPSTKPPATRRNVLKVTTAAGCWRGVAVVRTKAVDATTLKVLVKAKSRPKCSRAKTIVRTVSIPAKFVTFIDGATGKAFVPEEVVTY